VSTTLRVAYVVAVFFTFVNFCHTDLVWCNRCVVRYPPVPDIYDSWKRCFDSN
jgi:hypothetical protein